MNKFAITAACLAALICVPAAAAGDQLRVEVGYSQAFIGSDAGATQLAGAIEREVRTACGRQETRSLTTVVSCQDALLANAVEQLNAQGATLVAGKLAARG